MTVAQAGQLLFDRKDPELGSVLVLAPKVRFNELQETLARLGMAQDATDDLVGHTPEDAPLAAAFGRPGLLPRANYSHNPVADLHLLEVGTVPPFFRAQLASALPVVSRSEVAEWLQSGSERDMLRGLWAAVETERVDLLPAVAALAKDPRSLLSEEAKRAQDRLISIDTARTSVIGHMALVSQMALQMTEVLSQPGGLADLLAGPDDMKILFRSEAISELATEAQARVENGLRGQILPALDPADVSSIPAGLLRQPSRMSSVFPMGYRDFAGWMRPEVIWVTWKSADPSHGRVRFDGLAFADDRWIFCPRPMRLLSRALPKDALRFVFPGA